MRETKQRVAAYEEVKEAPRTTRTVGTMAAGSPEGDEHMEELVDHGLGMEETDQGLLRRPSLRESFHRDSLLAPDADFMTGRQEPATTVEVADAFVCSFVVCGGFFCSCLDATEVIYRSGQMLFIQGPTSTTTD